MPPAGRQAPPRGALDAFAGAIEAADRSAAAATPHPGRTPLHRMNRAEYANAIRDLLALDVDCVHAASRRRLESWLRQHRRRPRRLAVAARALRLCGGEDQPPGRWRSRCRRPAQVTYTVSGDLCQNQTLEGQPLGTRGGTIIRHNFPVDGEYLFRFSLLKLSFGPRVRRGAEGEQIEVTFNGERGEAASSSTKCRCSSWRRKRAGLAAADSAPDRRMRGLEERRAR